MIEIQCTSCHTRYRIDERVLPEDTPTFKCSRCGHVFNADPGAAAAKCESRPSAAPYGRVAVAAAHVRRARPQPNDKSPVGSRRESRAQPSRARADRCAEAGGSRPEARTVCRHPREIIHCGEATKSLPPPPAPAASAPDRDEKLKRTLHRRAAESMAISPSEIRPGENLRFDFNDEHFNDDRRPSDELGVRNHTVNGRPANARGFRTCPTRRPPRIWPNRRNHFGRTPLWPASRPGPRGCRRAPAGSAETLTRRSARGICRRGCSAAL